MMTGSSSGACFRIKASSAVMSGRRLSPTAAMYSAGVFTFSWPFMFIASYGTRRHQDGSGLGTDQPDQVTRLDIRSKGIRAAMTDRDARLEALGICSTYQDYAGNPREV